MYQKIKSNFFVNVQGDEPLIDHLDIKNYTNEEKFKDQVIVDIVI